MARGDWICNRYLYTTGNIKLIFFKTTHMKNLIILQFKKNGVVKLETPISPKQLLLVKEYITEVFINETGGLTIIVSICKK